MKKYLALVLALVMALSLVACGNKTAEEPSGDGDATEAILDQVERFAPGFRERIVGLHAEGPAQLEADNANYVGGDIVPDLIAANQAAHGRPGVKFIELDVVRDPFAVQRRCALARGA